MKPNKAITITPLGKNEDGDLRYHLALNRRSLYAFRLFYATARKHGASRRQSAQLAWTLCTVSA